MRRRKRISLERGAGAGRLDFPRWVAVGLAFLLMTVLVPLNACIGAAAVETPTGGAAAGQTSAETEGEAVNGSNGSDGWTGYMSLKYKFRTVRPSKEEDEDLFYHLKLDYISRPERRYEFHFLGLLRSDLDGGQDRRQFAPFEDIADTEGTSTVGYVFEALIGFNYLLSYLRQVRMGRQAGTRGEQLFFDGVAADLEASEYALMTLYGGYAVHFFELNNDGESDTLEGLGIDLFPGAPTQVSLDYLSVRDKRDPGPELRDRLVSFKVRQRFTRSWHGLARARYINGEQRDLKLRTNASFPGPGLAFGVTYFRQLRAQNELSQEFSSFYDVLGRSEPFQSIDLKLRWVFADDYGLDVGHFRRELEDAGDAGPFNRDFSRYFTVFDIANFLFDRFSTTLIGEHWEAGGSELDTVGFELAYRFGSGPRHTKLSAGTSYSLYKYDYYQELGERTRVRTTFVKAKVPLGKTFSVNGAYEYEDGEEIYQTVKTGVRYDF